MSDFVSGISGAVSDWWSGASGGSDLPTDGGLSGQVAASDIGAFAQASSLAPAATLASSDFPSLDLGRIAPAPSSGSTMAADLAVPTLFGAVAGTGEALAIPTAEAGGGFLASLGTAGMATAAAIGTGLAAALFPSSLGADDEAPAIATDDALHPARRDYSQLAMADLTPAGANVHHADMIHTGAGVAIAPDATELEKTADLLADGRRLESPILPPDPDAGRMEGASLDGAGFFASAIPGFAENADSLRALITPAFEGAPVVEIRPEDSVYEARRRDDNAAGRQTNRPILESTTDRRSAAGFPDKLDPKDIGQRINADGDGGTKNLRLLVNYPGQIAGFVKSNYVLKGETAASLLQKESENLLELRKVTPIVLNDYGVVRISGGKTSNYSNYGFGKYEIPNVAIIFDYLDGAISSKAITNGTPQGREFLQNMDGRARQRAAQDLGAAQYQLNESGIAIKDAQSIVTPDGTIRLNDPLKIIVKGESDTKTFNETSKDMNAKFDSVISNLLRR